MFTGPMHPVLGIHHKQGQSYYVEAFLLLPFSVVPYNTAGESVKPSVPFSPSKALSIDSRF
jgi:hypothetical protein